MSGRIHLRITPALTLEDMGDLLRLREDGGTVRVLGDRRAVVESGDQSAERFLRERGYTTDHVSAPEPSELPGVPVLERVT